MQLVEQLLTAEPAGVLDLVLRYHRRVQRARSSGSSWISEQGHCLRADLTHYTGHRFNAPFPGFKLGIVASLLRTTGRLPHAISTEEPDIDEVET